MGEGVFMKKKERRTEELGSQWLNTMCEVLIGGVLAGVTAILALLVCAALLEMMRLLKKYRHAAA